MLINAKDIENDSDGANDAISDMNIELKIKERKERNLNYKRMRVESRSRTRPMPRPTHEAHRCRGSEGCDRTVEAESHGHEQESGDPDLQK